ncbi:Hypothetical predicted protein [Mytilus galloprovincialis]|uniref:Reverse transcriptase domain-containing protein n=1 Tax=Mytilus galloprovincialis TaxID=29158 RepID=A0A8B6BUU1_MYTGA|nr:Hypothetical predicted protein [Mytilus galloprovincialis]
MLKKGVIEPSNSSWSSPICLVKKKDQVSWRFCIDYRRVNSLCSPSGYPLQKIDDCLASLEGAKWLSTVDCHSGYWQVSCDEEDREKTAFSTHKGLFQFRVMPMGLNSAAQTFQKLMEKVLGNLQWRHCLCYLDDIIIFGNNFEQALENHKLVFECLRAANLKLKPSKCTLFQKEVIFLGHVVSENGIKCDPTKIESVKDWPSPTNVSEIKSFLGFAGYYRKFISEFFTIASPLIKLTRKNQSFKWSDECEESFNKLKERLISAPILSFPKDEGLFILDTDASLNGVGAVLSQIQDEKEKVISYASRTLSKSQRNYCVTKRELLAVVTFVRQFRLTCGDESF